MVKIISNEEYAKLTRDVDYWKDLALREEKSKNFYETLYKEEKSWHRFYKEEHGKRVSDYMTLKEKYNKKAWLFKSFLLLYTKGELKND